MKRQRPPQSKKRVPKSGIDHAVDEQTLAPVEMDET